jgi:hypothetical protein
LNLRCSWIGAGAVFRVADHAHAFAGENGDFSAGNGHRTHRECVGHPDRGLGTSSHRRLAVLDTLRSREKEFSFKTNDGQPSWNLFIRSPR